MCFCLLGFPGLNIIEAYMAPAVDSSQDKFSWDKPDAALLAEFAREKLGWDRERIDEVLQPVMKKMSQNQVNSPGTLKKFIRIVGKFTQNLVCSSRVITNISQNFTHHILFYPKKIFALSASLS